MHRLLAALALILTTVLSAGPATAQQGALVDRVIAVVNDDVITRIELDRRIAQVRRQLRRQNIDAPAPDVLESQVLDRLIVDRIQLQMASERGIRVSDSQLDRAVERFAQENQLSLEQLQARVARDGISFDAFREDLRGEIIRQRLREREVDSKIVVSEADVDAWLSAHGSGPAQGDGQTEYHVGQILLKLAENAPAAEVERQRLRALEIVRQLERGVEFHRLAATFSDAGEAGNAGSLGWRTADRLPPLFLDAVRSLQPGSVAAPVRSPNGFHVLKLLGRRNAPLALADSQPIVQTHVRHILLQPNELMPEAEALRRLRDIRERVLAGTEKFEEMARQYSSDGSAGRGGDLGWVYPGDTVPEFERAMNALEPGGISDIVRTPFGLHLIQVLERRNDQASPERVRLAAKQALRAQRSDEAYENWLQQLRDSAYVDIRRE